MIQQPKQPRKSIMYIYKHEYFFDFKKSLATINSLSTSTSFLSCIVLRSILAFGYQTKIALVCFLNFFGIPK